MIHASIGRPIPVELTADPWMAGRIRRLAVTSLVALGMIWWAAEATLDAGEVVSLLLVSGWILMPLTLAASLRAAQIRYLLVVPASLVTLGLIGICLTALPPAPAAATGWLLITAGIVLGGWLGVWLWYRILPVPPMLRDPSAAGRWVLIGVHVGLVVGGWVLAASPLLMT